MVGIAMPSRAALMREWRGFHQIDWREWRGDGTFITKTLVSDIIDVTDDIGALPFEKYDGLAHTT